MSRAYPVSLRLHLCKFYKFKFSISLQLGGFEWGIYVSTVHSRTTYSDFSKSYKHTTVKGVSDLETCVDYFALQVGKVLIFVNPPK